MLTNLDNEVYFKKVFTDIDVFTAFEIPTSIPKKKQLLKQHNWLKSTI